MTIILMWSKRTLLRDMMTDSFMKISQSPVWKALVMLKCAFGELPEPTGYNKMMGLSG